MSEVEETTPESQEEDFEMVLLAIMVIASLLLGFKNRTKIKKWFDDLIGKIK
jgi:hypothetical protein